MTTRPFNDVDLHAFVDGQISAVRHAAVSRYLAGSPEDAAKVAQWQRQNETIRALFTPTRSEPVPLWLTVGHLATSRPAQLHGNGPAPILPATGQIRAAGPRQRRSGLSRSHAVVAALAFSAGIAAAILASQIGERSASWLKPFASTSVDLVEDPVQHRPATPQPKSSRAAQPSIPPRGS